MRVWRVWIVLIEELKLAFNLAAGVEKKACSCILSRLKNIALFRNRELKRRGDQRSPRYKALSKALGGEYCRLTAILLVVLPPGRGSYLI